MRIPAKTASNRAPPKSSKPDWKRYANQKKKTPMSPLNFHVSEFSEVKHKNSSGLHIISSCRALMFSQESSLRQS